VIFDTDVLIWFLRGNKKAADVLDAAEERYLSVQSYIELIQGVRNVKEQKTIRDLITELNFIRLPITENCCHRASILIEEYALSHGLRAGDAFIAATALELNFTLVSGNERHFKAIKGLKYKAFKL
jgi:predicted nucleic acid-binding protein